MTTSTSIDSPSSSKRPSTNSASTSAAQKRARSSPSKTESMQDEDEHSEQEEEGEMDESARAKKARKDARTIRNRESAQRSRNHRKAHLAYLETRVLELEKENRFLRSGEKPPPIRLASAERESSPAQSVVSIANEFGIPHEIVSSSGGVNLATVAPPPADLDVKPVIAPASPPSVQTSRQTNGPLVDLQAENQSLKTRVGLLENLVKQLIALSNLGTSSASSVVETPAQPAPILLDPAQVIDWQAILSASNDNTIEDDTRLNATLSPNMFPVQPLDNTSMDLSTSTTASFAPTLPPTSQVNLACHPAAGEDPFTWRMFGDDARTNRIDGQGPGRIGETARYTGRDQLAFNMADHNQNGAGQSTFETTTNGLYEEPQSATVAENWDEEMRKLLDNIDGRGDEVGARRAVGQGSMEQQMGWFGGMEMGNTILGLAV